ncbi:MAG: hypothetical protein IID46_16150 [Planctomycetes bacterium]|nr:hypothetical protein [Planctomycetota bacterium]
MGTDRNENRDTAPFGIDRVKDDFDFAMNSLDFPFFLSVPIREIRGSIPWVTTMFRAGDEKRIE